MTGPLHGLRVIELASLGPGPHAAMVLGDLGAEVVRVERPGDDLWPGFDGDPTMRHRSHSLTADLSTAEGRAVVLGLVEQADVLLEGMRPGVAERLGIGPAPCLARNSSLIYTRLTGWGQSGPHAERAGHDINYLALTGVLHSMGRAKQRPSPPLNLVGDYGGGSMLAVIGILAAVFERTTSGRGQVVDAAIVDGVSMLQQAIWSLRAADSWIDEREANLLDGGAPFYDVYECADGRFVAVGALEPQFFAQLLNGLGIDVTNVPAQYDRSGWTELRALFTKTFATRSRDGWAAVFDGVDACVTPVLTPDEVVADPHIRARGTVIDIDGVTQAAPAPRFYTRRDD